MILSPTALQRLPFATQTPKTNLKAPNDNIYEKNKKKSILIIERLFKLMNETTVERENVRQIKQGLTPPGTQRFCDFGKWKLIKLENKLNRRLN